MLRTLLCAGLCLFGGWLMAQEESVESDSLKNWEVNFYLNADAYYRLGTNKSGSFSAPSYKHNQPGLGWINPKVEVNHKNMLLVVDAAYGEKQASFYAVEDTLWHSFLKELYAEYTFANRFHASLGAYTTHFNFEYSEPGLNAIYSPSFLYTYIPATYTGLRLTYDLTEFWSVFTGLYNDKGSDRFSFGKIRNIAAGLAYVSDEKNLALNFITGEDFQATQVTSIELYGDKYLTERFNLGFDLQHYSGKILNQTNRTGWNAIALYGLLSINDQWQLGSRVELFSDAQGFAFGTEQNRLFDFTLCGKYFIPKTNLQIVGEYRFDASNTLFFENKATSAPYTRNLNQVTLAVIYSDWE